MLGMGAGLDRGMRATVRHLHLHAPVCDSATPRRCQSLEHPPRQHQLLMCSTASPPPLPSHPRSHFPPPSPSHPRLSLPPGVHVLRHCQARSTPRPARTRTTPHHGHRPGEINHVYRKVLPPAQLAAGRGSSRCNRQQQHCCWQRHTCPRWFQRLSSYRAVPPHPPPPTPTHPHPHPHPHRQIFPWVPKEPWTAGHETSVAVGPKVGRGWWALALNELPPKPVSKKRARVPQHGETPAPSAAPPPSATQGLIVSGLICYDAIIPEARLGNKAGAGER